MLTTVYQLLNDIHEVFKRNDMVYWADGGSLLGYERHGGIIPWDDDGDILMPLAHTATLFSDAFSKELVEHNMQVAPFNKFAKLSQIRSTVKGFELTPHKNYNAPFVDIFFHDFENPVPCNAADTAPGYKLLCPKPVENWFPAPVAWIHQLYNPETKKFRVAERRFGSQLMNVPPCECTTVSYMQRLYKDSWNSTGVQVGYDHIKESGDGGKQIIWTLEQEDRVPGPGHQKISNAWHDSPAYRNDAIAEYWNDPKSDTLKKMCNEVCIDVTYAPQTGSPQNGSARAFLGSKACSIGSVMLVLLVGMWTDV